MGAEEHVVLSSHSSANRISCVYYKLSFLCYDPPLWLRYVRVKY